MSSEDTRLKTQAPTRLDAMTSEANVLEPLEPLEPPEPPEPPESFESFESFESDTTAVSITSAAPSDSDSPSMSGDRQETAWARLMHMLGSGGLGSLVRLSGAGMILFAVSLFLLQGVESTNDLQRFLWLLSQTGLLGVAGLGVGYLLKEPRGARLFFFLGLVSIPANMAVIGAMIHSLLPAAQARADEFPFYVDWQASSLSQVAMALAAAVLVLIPMAWFAFSVFARHARGWLTAAYLAGSTLLLIPVRESLPSFTIAAAMSLSVLLLLRRMQTGEARHCATEERLSRLILFIPPAILAARSATLYSSGFNVFLVFFIAIYLVLRHCSSRCQRPLFLHQLLHLFTALSATCLAVFLTNMAVFSGWASMANLIFALVLAALLLDLARVVPSTTLRWWMHAGWALCCLPTFLGSYVMWNGIGSMLSIALICMMMIVSGRLFENRFVVVLGVISVLGNLLLHGQHMVYGLFQSNWLTLALLGAAIVVGGSLIDRFGPTVQQKLQRRLQQLSRQGRPDEAPGDQPIHRRASGNPNEEQERRLLA